MAARRAVWVLNTARLRADALAGLARFGIEVEPAANEGVGSGVAPISRPAAEVDVLVVPTNEELAMARSAVALLPARM